MADDVYIGGKQISNPNNAQVQDSDAPVLNDTDSAPAISTQKNSRDSFLPNPMNATDQLRSGLTERGQPRDLDNWSNGESSKIADDPETWTEEDTTARGAARSKISNVSSISKDTHDVVATPSGHTVAIPKNLPPEQKASIMKGFWSKLNDVSNSVKNAASNAAQAVGLPGSMPEFAAKEDAFMRDPIGEAGDAVGALIHGMNTQLQQVNPLSDENKALVQRATDQYNKGNKLAAAVTLVPMVGDNLAKAVLQAQKHDISGSLGTAAGTALPFMMGDGENPAENPAADTSSASIEHPVEPEPSVINAFKPIMDKWNAEKAGLSKYTGAERRAGARPALMSPTEMEAALKNRKPVSTPFDVTEGAMDTINKDLEKRVGPRKPTAAEDTAFFNKKEAESKKIKEPEELLYHGANAEGTKAIERNKEISPAAFTQAHLTPDPATAEAYARSHGGKVFKVKASDVPPDALKHYRQTKRGPIILRSEHSVPIAKAEPFAGTESALA